LTENTARFNIRIFNPRYNLGFPKENQMSKQYMDFFTAVRKVQSATRDLLIKRSQDKDPPTYQSARDAMIQLHTDWQGLMVAVKQHDIANLASKAAIKLAASAIKFAQDLGTVEPEKKGT